MDSSISYRINATKPDSIQAFINENTVSNNEKNVWFIRALGESDNFANDINELDNILNKANIKYFRFKELSKLTSYQDSENYASLYDKWNSTNKIELNNISISDELNAVFSDSLKKVIEIYKASRPAVSDSMVKSFCTKIFFWLDNSASEFFKDWNTNINIKIISENILKDQEFFFFYFLCLCGCDVLLFQNKKDCTLTENSKDLSFELRLGSFGNYKIPEFKKAEVNNTSNNSVAENNTSYKAETSSSGSSTDNSSGEPIVMSINRFRRADRNNSVVVNSSAQQNTTNSSAQHENKERRRMPTFIPTEELSYEELAKLASSIVMIKVLDKEGKIYKSGSGIMIGRDGYILTNCHVAAGGISYIVTIENDSEEYATKEIIKYNQVLDLAIIRIKRELDPLPIFRGPNELVRGQKVVAIGSPLGLFNSVSDGIISGFRDFTDVSMIQFTAPTSSGSSGGAVLNMYGQVIGISTAGIDEGQNINLAVSYKDILSFAGNFIK